MRLVRALELGRGDTVAGKRDAGMMWSGFWCVNEVVFYFVFGIEENW